jgi:hypothetical protein
MASEEKRKTPDDGNENTRFIYEEYLEVTPNPTFHHFIAKFSDKIAVFQSQNAFKLMTTWINLYNRSINIYRKPDSPFAKTVNNLLKDGMKTSTKYSLRSGQLIRAALDENEDEVEIKQDGVEVNEPENATSQHETVNNTAETDLIAKYQYGDYEG